MQIKPIKFDNENKKNESENDYSNRNEIIIIESSTTINDDSNQMVNNS